VKGLQRLAGVGALLLAASFVLLIVSNAIIQPGLGLNSPADQLNPAKVFPVASTLRLVFSVPILFAVAFTLIVVGLNDRLQERSPGLMRLALASGLGGAVLFLASGMFAFDGLAVLAGLYAQSPASVTAGDLALAGGVSDGLLTAGIFAAGWFVALASWAALRGGLPRILNYLGLLFGVLSILAFAIPPFSLLGGVVGLVWAVWLAIALWM
jgi:hypothetical protein